MKLLIFAHRGEAQSFISYFKLKSQNWNLGQYYTNEQDLSLLIIGEGTYQAILQTTAFLSQFREIKSVINLGIAGALKKNFQKFDFVSVRTAYAFSDSPEYKSFSCAASVSEVKLVDCLSYTQRLTQKMHKEKLSPFADIVDREIWGIAQAAQSFKVSWQSFKIISDVTDEETACLDIFEAAKEFSDGLLKNYLELKMENNQAVSEEKNQLLSHSDFHFTFSQRHLLLDLNERIQLKSPGKKIDSIFIDSLIGKKITPKQRTQLLLEHLQESLNPWMKVLKNNLEKTLSPFNNQNLKVEVDPTFESNEISVKFHFQTKQELFENLSKLEVLPVEKIYSLLNGEIHD